MVLVSSVTPATLFERARKVQAKLRVGWLEKDAETHDTRIE
jgi:hypothetical protein